MQLNFHFSTMTSADSSADHAQTSGASRKKLAMVSKLDNLGALSNSLFVGAIDLGLLSLPWLSLGTFPFLYCCQSVTQFISLLNNVIRSVTIIAYY